MIQGAGKRAVVFTVLCMVALIGMAATKVSRAEEKPAFERQVAIELLEEEKFAVSDDSVQMQEDDKAGGVMISGKPEKLGAAVFEYGGVYQFGEDTADYLMIDALAERKKKIELAFYLDDEKTPFTTVVLAKQKKAEIWSTVKNRCVSLGDKGIKGTHRLRFRVVLAEGETKKNHFVLRSVTFMRRSLPVVSFSIDETQGTIDAMNGDGDHNTECYGSMTLDVPDGYHSEYTDEPCQSQTYTLDYIRGRGNSTWGNDKKPYKIKLEQKEDLLGMGANKHWVLLANYFDITMLRNKTTYWLGAQLGMEFTPKCAFVDVVMNGEYLGSYYLCEQVRVGKTRVDIDDLDENKETMQATDPETISGGYLLSMFPYRESGKKGFFTTHGNEFLIESPSFEEYDNEVQAAYIADYVQKTENAIYGKDFKDEEGKSYAEYMDVDSAIDYYWIQEVSKNGDGFISGSTYLYKKRNGKLYWGPLWDFDYVAWGATEYEGNYVMGFQHNTSTWFGRLFQDPEFCEKAKERWPAIRGKLLAAAVENPEDTEDPRCQIDKYSEQQYESQKHNYEIWNMYSDSGYYSFAKKKGNLPERNYSGDEYTEPDFSDVSYDSEVERFKEWIKERVEWIDNNLDAIAVTPPSVIFVSEGEVIETISVEDGTLQRLPEEPVREGYTFEGWYVTEEVDGEEYTYELKPGMLINDETTAVARWSEGEDNRPEVKEIAFLRNEYYMVEEEERELIYCTLPFEAKAASIVWISNNPDVATVVGGRVTAVSSGDVTITATVENGATESCIIHVLTWEDMMEEGEYFDHVNFTLTDTKFTVEKGAYARLPMTITPEKAFFYDLPLMASSDESVAEVNNCGYVYGKKAGTSVVIIYDFTDNSIQCCTVTVRDSSANAAPKPTQAPQKTQQTQSQTGISMRVGMTFVLKGLQYQITSLKQGSYKVACMSVTNKKIKKVNVPATVTFRKKIFAVTSVDGKCFFKCKKLKRVILGKNVKKFGKNIFKGCKKLKRVSVRNVKKRKKVEKLLKKVKIKAKVV